MFTNEELEDIAWAVEMVISYEGLTDKGCKDFSTLRDKALRLIVKTESGMCVEKWHSPVILENGVCPLCSEIEKHIGSVHSNSGD